MVSVEEPFKKLINQGMILGESAFAHRINEGYYNFKESFSGIVNGTLENFDNIFDEIFKGRLVSWQLLEGKKLENSITGEKYKLTDVFNIEDVFEYFKGTGFDPEKITFTTTKIHVPVEFVDLKNNIVWDRFASWYQGELYNSSLFRSKNDEIGVSREVEKMSKSKYNVVNPDEICKQYGADTLRMYEMFLGPLEQAKPWNTAGITGVHGFLKKLWKLYHTGPDNSFHVTNSPPLEGSGEAFKSLHKTIKKVTEDIEDFSFNTSVSTFMICVNELTALKCNSREILEPLVILIAPYAPHIAEELWEKLGHSESVSIATYPVYEEKYLVESNKLYPISFNGKMRFTMELPMDFSVNQIEEAVMGDERTQKQLEGRTPKKVIIVPGKIVNIVG